MRFCIVKLKPVDIKIDGIKSIGRVLLDIRRKDNSLLDSFFKDEDKYDAVVFQIVPEDYQGWIKDYITGNNISVKTYEEIYEIVAKEQSKTVVEKVEEKIEKESFDNLKWQELMKLAKERGVYKKGMKKAEILDVLYH